MSGATEVGEQNVYARAKNLVGDHDPRGHELSIQLRAMDNDRSSAGLVGRRKTGQGAADARLRPPGAQRPARLWFN